MLLASGSHLHDGKAEAHGLIESDYPPLDSAIKPKGGLEKDQILESFRFSSGERALPRARTPSRNSTNSDKTGDFSLSRLISVFLSQANGSGGECSLEFDQKSDTRREPEVPDVILGEGGPATVVACSRPQEF